MLGLSFAAKPAVVGALEGKPVSKKAKSEQLVSFLRASRHGVTLNSTLDLLRRTTGFCFFRSSPRGKGLASPNSCCFTWCPCRKTPGLKPDLLVQSRRPNPLNSGTAQWLRAWIAWRIYLEKERGEFPDFIRRRSEDIGFGASIPRRLRQLVFRALPLTPQAQRTIGVSRGRCGCCAV